MPEFLETLFLRDYNTRVVVLGTALLGVTCGLIGSFLLLRKRSLLGDALAHSTLPGIGIAFLIMVAYGSSGKNLGGLLLGATLSGLLGMAVVIAVHRGTRLKDDAAMGIALSVFFGLGISILRIAQDSPHGSAAGLESYIYGKPASMIAGDIALIRNAAVIVIACTIFLFKEFTLLCFDEGFASSQGWPVLLLDLLLVLLVTAVTVVGLQAVGLILIIAFLITPAAAARFWTNRLAHMLWIAVLIGGASGWIGASASDLYDNLPAGAMIVVTGSGLFLFSMFFGTARGVVRLWIESRRLNVRVDRQHLLRAAYEILEQSRPSRPVTNLPIPIDKLLAHRSWTPLQLHRNLRRARREDHLEHANGSILLSESGFGEAARITRNHRLWELYLIKHADVAPSHVDRDADMVEHVLGAEIVRQLESEVGPAIPPSPHQIQGSHPTF